MIARLLQVRRPDGALPRKMPAGTDWISAMDEDLHLVRAKIVDAVMDTLKIVAPATLAIAIYRSASIGILDGASTILICAVMYVVALNKRRLSFGFKAASLVLSTIVGSLLVLVTRGLLSPGAICFLAFAPSLVWILFGRRQTVIVAAAIVLCMGLIAEHTVSARHLPSFDAVSFMVSPTAWISTIAMICICGWSVLFIFSAYAGELSAEVRRHTLALEDANRKLLALSTTDGLTGLANRRHFDATLAAECERCGRSRLPLTLIMVDVDWFKKYNDRYGHQAGDECLVRIARVLQAGARRAGDLAARYGGEEFTLILPGVDSGTAPKLAETLRSSVETLGIAHEDNPAGIVTVSAGIATVLPGAGMDGTVLLRAADEALYRAKNNGRNRTSVATIPVRIAGADYAISKEFVQLAWRAAYECGHVGIDDEHRALFRHAADLLAAVLSEREEADVAHLMNVLVRAVEQHFRNEEAILEEAGFPDAKAHAEIHRELLDRAAAMIEAGPPGGGVLFEFLAEDLVAKHMLGADREYFPYLKSRGEMLSPVSTRQTAGP
jgi:diguanylate cyclase (GGDEF)-like protein/hemerythrin-like metal-binding protein